MADLFASGRIIDLILGLVAIEAIALMVSRWTVARGPAIGEVAATLLSGAFLLLALRGALVDAWWGWIALPLMAALVAHLADLWARWR